MGFAAPLAPASHTVQVAIDETLQRADCFSASMLMQSAIFAPYAKASGLDIIALMSQFRFNALTLQ